MPESHHFVPPATKSATKNALFASLMCATFLFPSVNYAVAAEQNVTETTAEQTAKNLENKSPEDLLNDMDTGQLLKEVVVSATGFEQTIRDAPASISVVPRDELEKGEFRDLTDALKSLQGVAVTGSAAESDIYMRGLPGEYTLILVDGKRQTTREARTNGSAGFEQSFIPPMNAIERIEVVRGPMSSLYGSDAMGGVINIITRKIPQKWTGSFTADGTANQHSRYGNTAQGNYYLAGPIIQDILGVQLWGRNLYRQEDSVISGMPKKKERDFTGRLTFTPNRDHEFTLQGGQTRLRQYSTVGNVIDANSGRSASDGYNMNDRDHWLATYTGRFAHTTAEFSAMQEVGKRKNYTRDSTTQDYFANARAPEIRNRVYDGKFTTPFSLGGSHTLVTGGQFIDSRLRDQNPGLRDEVMRDYKISQWALFAEDEWWLNDKLALTGGARYDHHEIYGGNWSPRGYLVWHANNNLTVKGGVSTGFRAPEIRDIAPGYAYTTGGRNCYYGPAAGQPAGSNRCAVIISDDNLKPEKSTSYEASIIWDNLDNLQLGMTAFYTDFKDKLTDVKAYDQNGNQLEWDVDPNYVVHKNMNIDHSRMQGVELTASWKIIESLSMRANYTYTDSEQKTGEYKGLPLARTPKHMANIRADWKTPIEKLAAWSAANYHGEEIKAGFRAGSAGKPIYRDNQIVARKYDDYLTFDIGTSYEFNENLRFNAAIYNMFDKRVDADEFNDVVEGRRVWASITASF